MPIPIGIKLAADIEVLERSRSGNPFRARVRWTDPVTKTRPSKSETFGTEEQAQQWIDRLVRLSARDVDPIRACVTLAQYSADNMELALKGRARVHVAAEQ
ncbi:hypothetical protein [Nocardia sp. IFM 10818]